jgi:hypothetical protein
VTIATADECGVTREFNHLRKAIPSCVASKLPQASTAVVVTAFTGFRQFVECLGRITAYQEKRIETARLGFTDVASPFGKRSRFN